MVLFFLLTLFFGILFLALMAAFHLGLYSASTRVSVRLISGNAAPTLYWCLSCSLLCTHVVGVRAVAATASTIATTSAEYISACHHFTYTMLGGAMEGGLKRKRGSGGSVDADQPDAPPPKQRGSRAPAKCLNVSFKYRYVLPLYCFFFKKKVYEGTHS